MNKIITFIIPAYNVEKYIEKCLSSFINSKVISKIEVLIINDGSSDRTTDIVHNYLSRYPETFYLYSKENGGHGSAINEGVKHARGKYIKVIDADDWVVTENLSTYVEKLEQCEADVVLTHYHTFHMVEKSYKEYKVKFPEYNCSYNMEYIMENWNDVECGFTLHGLTYLLEFYKNHCIELSEKIFYEDHEYATIPSWCASTIVPIDIFLYQYMIGNSEQSVSDQAQLKRITHLKSVIDRLTDCYEKWGRKSEAEEKFYYKKIEVVILRYYVVACFINKDKRKGIKLCKELNKDIARTNPSWAKKLKKKYDMYRILLFFNIDTTTYYKLIQYKNKLLRGK